MKSLIRILITVFVVIFIYSCSNDTTVNNITTSELFTLNGTIEPWLLGGNVKLKAELFDTTFFGPVLTLDSTIINANGDFTLKLRNAPDSLLYTFTNGPSCISTVIVNPPGTKSSSFVGLNLYNDSMPIGIVYRSNYSIDTNIIPGQFFVYYLYYNQNVSITGSTICNSGLDTTIFNFSGTQGWNKVVVLYNYYTQNGSNVTVSTTEPAGGKWRAITWSSDTLSSKLSLRQRMFSFNNCITCR